MLYKRIDTIYIVVNETRAMGPEAVETCGSAAYAEEYYDHLKRTAQGKGKLELPTRLVDTAMALDRLTSFKKQFVCFTAVLTVMYRQKTVQNRKISLLEMKSNPKAIKSPNRTHSNLSRTAVVSDVLKQCKSNAAKSAIAMFCLLQYKETIRRDVLFAILLDSFDSVTDIVKLVTDNVKAIKEAVHGRTTCSEECRKSLIRTLLETSDVLRDRSFSKLAMAVHPKMYLLAVKYYIEKNQFASIYPYDALMNNYIQTCIASKSQASEREKIVNQFEVNACAIVENMIGSLPDRNESSAKTVKFEDGRIYHVFEGPANFPRYLNHTYKKFDGKYYQIVTYKDCLYDVIGTEDELFCNKTWPERLNSIDYSAKIIIETKTGAELNEYSGNATLAACWMEDNRIHCNYYTFMRRDKRTGKN